MPRGKQLTDLEIGQIIAFKKQLMSNRRIAQELKRSEKIVRTYLRQASRKQPKKRVGRPSKLKVRDVRRIFRLATVSQMSSKKIAALLEEKAKEDNPRSSFTLHYTTVLKVLRASKFAKYIKRKKKPQAHDQAQAATSRVCRPPPQQTGRIQAHHLHRRKEV